MTGTCDKCGEVDCALTERDYGTDPATGYKDSEWLCEDCLLDEGILIDG